MAPQPGRAAARPAQSASTRGPRPGGPTARVVRRRRAVVITVLVLVVLLAWPIGLVIWADARIRHVEALVPGPKTPGTTYLIAGSDGREDGTIPDGTEGARTDTVMLLTKPKRGTSSLVSIPRDVVVQVDGRKMKLNAAYAVGGPEALVGAVQDLTGIEVDHYVEVKMGGVVNIVDAVGGVNLCWDHDVDDPQSEMVWEAGCHDVDGRQALAYARMRKSDPLGDFGRGIRQQNVIHAILAKVKGPAMVLPWEQVQLISAATSNLETDPGTGILGLAQMALAFRAATGPDGFRGAPPVSDPDYRGDGLGSTVLLDPEAAPLFWQQVVDGTLPTQGSES